MIERVTDGDDILRPCPKCGKERNKGNTTTYLRDGVRVYRYQCKDCYNARKRELYVKGRRAADRPKPFPEAPPGRMYCTGCHEINGHLPIELFPFRKDKGKIYRRRKCVYCINVMRTRHEATRKNKRIAEAIKKSPEAVKPHVYRDPHVSLSEINRSSAAILAENLENLLDKNRCKNKKRPDYLLTSSQVYRRAWRSIKSMAWPIDYPVIRFTGIM